jgi:hypothetical protein
VLRVYLEQAGSNRNGRALLYQSALEEWALKTIRAMLKQLSAFSDVVDPMAVIDGQPQGLTIIKHFLTAVLSVLQAVTLRGSRRTYRKRRDASGCLRTTRRSSTPRPSVPRSTSARLQGRHRRPKLDGLGERGTTLERHRGRESFRHIAGGQPGGSNHRSYPITERHRHRGPLQ